LTVIVEDPPAVSDEGLKLTVAPDGAPAAARPTDCADPLVTAVEMTEEPLAPAARLRLDGLALSEKSFAGGGADDVARA
jgi:hypothetical protein